MKARFLAVVLMFAVLGAATAWADFTTTFSTSGTTSGGSVSGSAVFNVTSGGMTITLTNSTATPMDIAQVLDGFHFTLSGPVAGLALTNVSASGFEECTGNGASTTCSSVPSFQDFTTSPPTTISSPYTWTLAGSTPYVLDAGAGSFKPGGIVNTTIMGADGLGNAQHNDYLVGPVTYTFSFTTAPTDADSATFLWGTTPESTSGSPTVPDGGMTLMLLGGALVGLGTLRRRFTA